MKTAQLDLDGMLRRLHLPTMRRLYSELVTRAEEDGMGYRDYLATLVAEEIAHRAQTRIERAVRVAHFPFFATIEDFDFTFQSSVKMSLLGSFLGPELIGEGRTLILSGKTGLGKTHLAIAIAYKAIQNGGTALFDEASHIIDDLSDASKRGRLRKALAHYVQPDVLVIDELGYLSYPADAANVLFQVVNQRYLKKRSMVITTNKDLELWKDVLHDADLADAIIDRVLARGRHIKLIGESHRTRHVRGEKPSVEAVQATAKISGKRPPKFPEPTGVNDGPLNGLHTGLAGTRVSRVVHRQRCIEDQDAIDRSL